MPLFNAIEKEIRHMKQQQRHRRRQGIRQGPLQRGTVTKAPTTPTGTGGFGRLPSPNKGGERPHSSRRKKGSPQKKSRPADNQDAMTRQRIVKRQKQLNSLHKELNSLKFKCKKTEADVHGRKSKLEMLRRDDNVAETRKNGFAGIRRLQTKMEAKKGELEELLQYKDVMNHMASTLWNAQYTYEKTLQTYEEALRVQLAEAAEVRDMAQQVKKLKETEERALSDLQSQCKMKRKSMEKELQERRKLKKQREEMRTCVPRACAVLLCCAQLERAVGVCGVQQPKT